MALVGGFKLTSPFLINLNNHKKAVEGKKYVDSNGSVYIGQADGRLLFDQLSASYSKEEIDNFLSDMNAGIQSQITNITNVIAFGTAYAVINVLTTPYVVIPIVGNVKYLVDCTVGNITMNFPSAVTNTALYTVKKVDGSANTIILTPNGTETLDGSATKTIRFQNTSVDIYSDNSDLILE